MKLVGRLHARAVFGRRVRVLAAHIATLLPSNARVLDVGCGDGSIATVVMRLRPDIDVTGLDVLVRSETHIPVRPFDGERIPFDEHSFDAVLFVDVLHHTDDPTQLLGEASRVASKAIVIKDHLADGFLARPTLRVMDWFGNAHFGVTLPYNYWPMDRWRRAFAELGLTTEESITDLLLYPRPASWVFGRKLHVLWRLTAPGHASSAGD